MTTEQLIEKLRKSGLEEVDARTSRVLFKINDDKFIEILESSQSCFSVIFWHFIIPKQNKDTTLWERMKIHCPWDHTRTPDEFEEHFTRFLNA